MNQKLTMTKMCGGFLLIVLLVRTSSATGASKQFTELSPPNGEALVYVYRQATWAGKGGDNVITFINGNYLASLHYSDYVAQAVPPGRVVLTSSGRLVHNRFPPDLGWSPGSGCASMDWWHLETARSADVARCKTELGETLEAVTHLIAANKLQGTDEVRKQVRMCVAVVGPGQGYPEAGDLTILAQKCRSDVREALELLNQQGSDDNVFLKARVEFEAEAGKTYYVREFSSMTVIINMTLVDTATGAKEIRGKHPAKHLH